jgi:hypothetical protein
MLQKNGGTCIFPVGDCKSLCGAITLLGPQGEHTPFCAKHKKEVDDIFRFKQQKENKREHHMKGAPVYHPE